MEGSVIWHAIVFVNIGGPILMEGSVIWHVIEGKI